MMKKIPYLIVALAFSCITSCALAKENLIFAIDLIRHGDRTPIKEIPTLPLPWKEGVGELTAQGMQQEFQLGKKLRGKYIYQYHLLPSQYEADTMYVRSSDFNRTLVSAQSLLLGLYPQGTGPILDSTKKPALPAAYQPIPIHTLPKGKDNLLVAKPSSNVLSIIPFYIWKYKAWHEINFSYKTKVANWSQLTGININDLHPLVELADNLYIRKLHNLPLPKGLNSKDVSEIIQLGRGANIELYKQQAMSYPIGQEFLKVASTYMQDRIEGKSRLKYVLFSAHDSTIMSVMKSLGCPLDDIPKYASDLNFSLYQENNKYYIKVTLNDEPVNIANCQENICSLTQFYKLGRL